MLDLSQMKQLEAKATKGPYFVDMDHRNGGSHQVCVHADDGRVLTLCFISTGWADEEAPLAMAEMFAASRTWIPEAIAEIERLRARLSLEAEMEPRP